jgi:hypothetical protein
MRRLLIPLVLLTALLPAGAARAEPFPVSNTEDDGAGSLRAAIEGANGNSGADTIPIGATGTIELATALPTITDDVTITGPGAGSLTVERNAATAFRIFEFGAGVTASVSNLTVRDGIDTAGAGILNGSGNLTLTRVVITGNHALVIGGGINLAAGGGVLSIGALTLRESFIHDNAVTARGASEENVASGGGVEALGPLTVERSTISGNFVQALGGDDAKVVASGGGLRVETGPVTIEESTISGNSVLAAEGMDVSVARGGGIQGDGIALTGSTVTGNSAATDAAGATTEFAAGANLAVAAGSSVRNSIVAEPQGSESCAVTLPSGGYNLDEDGSCGFDQGSDLNEVAAGLDPVLRFNGGPTPTHALLEGSIAIDRGNSFGSSVDQRGLPRPVDLPAISNKEGGDGSDIGAFELQALLGSGQASILVSTVPADRQPPNTRIVSGPARNTYRREAKFRFASTEPQSKFQCKLDKGKWRRCRNPWKRKVRAGAKHVFKVRAIDRFGNVDPTPARFGWRVKRIGG